MRDPYGKLRKTVRLFTPAEQAALLRVLASPSERRAQVIRDLHEHPESRQMAELLMDLEEEGLIRADVMEALRDSLANA